MRVSPRIWAFFVASVAVHALLLALFVWIHRFEGEESVPVSEVRIQFQSPPLRSPPSKGLRTRSSSDVVRGLFRSQDQLIEGGDVEGESDGHSGSSALSDLESSPLLNTLWSDLEQNLVYDSVLRKKRETGSVFVRFSLTPEGDLDWSKLRVRSDSPYLKVAVVRAFRGAFGKRIPLEFIRGDWQKPFEASFSFEEVETTSDAFSREIGVAGRRLLFHRTSIRSKLQWDIGPLSGMFPFPTLAFNPLWFLEDQEGDESQYKMDPAFSKDFSG